MPCYNAAEYLPEALNSVLRQTFQQWELVVVDDCSTDKSYDILQTYANKDARIRVYRLGTNSGSCKLPRDTAASYSKGEWVIKFDADDYLQPDCLEKLLLRQRETDADIVCGRMILVDAGANVISTCPKEGFDFSALYTGEQAFCLTVNGWVIGFNGALVRKSIWQSCEHFLSTAFLHQSADECAEREMFAKARLVACTKADYMYRQLENSISHNKDHLWEWVISDYEIMKMAKVKFGQDSEAYNKAKCAFVNRLHTILRIDMRNREVPERLCCLLQKLSVADVLTTSGIPFGKRIKYARHFIKWKKTLCN